MADTGLVDVVLGSPRLSINGIVVTDLEARLDGSDAGQSLALTGAYADTPFRLFLRGALTDWRKPLASRFDHRARRW